MENWNSKKFAKQQISQCAWSDYEPQDFRLGLVVGITPFVQFCPILWLPIMIFPEKLNFTYNAELLNLQYNDKRGRGIGQNWT